MVLVVGDVEADQLTVLAVVVFNKREDQTTELLFGAVDFERLLSTVLQPGIRQALGIGDRHGDDIALVQLRSIEVTGTKENAHHVIHAVLIRDGLPVLLTVGIDAMHAQLAVVVGIGIPQFVDIVALAFEGAFTVIEGR